ncbi:hypothetical protein DMN91_001546 [Ooceraea biroi]|uniref:Uncharacterized protein n=1 Tax=Ooceraea biroi TaxID=2015173 RepID=A0A3L8DY49_OOCBI|nr:hypothetical protein DMN91_001546 [Ooceraea biroi]
MAYVMQHRLAKQYRKMDSHLSNFKNSETKDVLDEIPKVDVSRILRDDLQLPVLSHEAATWQKKKLPEATSRSVKMLNDVHANIMKGLENQYGKPIQVSTKRTVLRTVGCSI